MHLADPKAQIYVAGHNGLVGSAVMSALHGRGYTNAFGVDRAELDLRRQSDVDLLFEKSRPDFVVMAAARAGGILANHSYPADFISDNLAIQTNVIQAAHRNEVSRLLFLGSSCIYPKRAPQPLKEEYLLTGPLEPTLQWYAVAKIAGVKLCEAFARQYGNDFVSLLPTNVYGPNDNFDEHSGHVLAGLMGKFHRAKLEACPEVVLWGTGKPRREFLYVDDLADAVVFLLECERERLQEAAPDGRLNVGVGKDIEVRELADMIRDVVGADVEIMNDLAKPDGTPRKLLDVSRLATLGWHARTDLRDGLLRTYRWFSGQKQRIKSPAV